MSSFSSRQKIHVEHFSIFLYTYVHILSWAIELLLYDDETLEFNKKVKELMKKYLRKCTFINFYLLYHNNLHHSMFVDFIFMQYIMVGSFINP